MPKTVDDLLAALAELERGMTLDAVEQVVEGFDFERVGPAMTARRYGVTLHFERHLNSPRLDAPEDFTLLEIEVRCRRDTLLRRDPPLGADVECELSDGDLRLRVAPGGRVLGLRLPPGVRSEVLRQVLAEHAAVQETEPTATETAPAPAHDAEDERELQRRYLQRKLDRGQELLEELRRRGGGGYRDRVEVLGQLEAGGTSLTLDLGDREARVSILHSGRAYQIIVAIRHEDASPGLVERLGERLWRRPSAHADRSWAEALLEDPSQQQATLRRGLGRIVLEVETRRLPTVDTLRRWCDAVAARLGPSG